MLYTYRANTATSRIEEAKAAGAEKTATYEYTLAQEHLRKSMTEASEADYGDAYELAGLASDYAQAALDKAKYRTSNEAPKSESAEAATQQGQASISLSTGEPQ